MKYLNEGHGITGRNVQQEGSCKRCLIGYLDYGHATKLVYSGLKWCLVNGASILLKWGANKRYLPVSESGAVEIMPFG